jgi:hypothetical protein
MYLGWWELNFKALRANVISLYMADELRRVGCETVLPMLIQNKSKVEEELKSVAEKIKNRKETNEIKTQMETPSAKTDEQMERLVVLEELGELEKDEHELFDDFMEMVVTFGYITLFGSVFTLGATCIFVFILIEARSDIFRLDATCRRPMPGKTYNIGSWAVLMGGFCFLSIFSNVIISCYASSQMDNLLPGFKEAREDPAQAATTVF